MRLLIAGPACEGLAAALDALHGGAEGPITDVAACGGCSYGALVWAGARAVHDNRAVRYSKVHSIDDLGEVRWPTLVLVTPGDTSGAADMAREAGIPVREVGT